MSTERKVAVLVGSLSKDSHNLKLAKALVAVAPAGLSFAFVEIGDLPHYNVDLEPAPPASWTRFRDIVRPLDAVLFVTPEFNRSVPSALKNALDVGSRPYGSSIWDGKPSAVVSGSAGAIGGFGANHHLRQSLVFLNMPCMAQPEAYIGSFYGMFDDNDQLKSDDTRKFLAGFMAAFAQWIDRNAPK